MPELDDEFASEVSDFETMEEYRSSVRKEIQEKKDQEAKLHRRKEALERAVRNAELDIPEEILEFQQRNAIEDYQNTAKSLGLTLKEYIAYLGITIEEFNFSVRVMIEHRVRTSLVLEAIAKAENITATDE